VLGVTASPASSNLSFRLDLASLDLAAGLGAGYQTDHLKYVIRWSFGRDVWFVAADTDGTNTSFYGGRVDANDAILNPVTPTAVFGSKYVADFSLDGTVANGAITINVPRDMVGSPKDGARLYSLQAFTLAGSDDNLVTLYTQPDQIDASAPVDLTIAAQAVVKAVVRHATERALPATGVGASLGIALVLFACAGAVYARLTVR
jgi:hypothetical protein